MPGTVITALIFSSLSQPLSPFHIFSPHSSLRWGSERAALVELGCPLEWNHDSSSAPQLNAPRCCGSQAVSISCPPVLTKSDTDTHTQSICSNKQCIGIFAEVKASVVNGRFPRGWVVTVQLVPKPLLSASRKGGFAVERTRRSNSHCQLSSIFSMSSMLSSEACGKQDVRQASS